MSSRCDECGYQDDAEFHACYICMMEKDMFRKKSKPTNAARIRAMTDEELAVWINKEYGSAPWCKSWTNPSNPCDNMDCVECIVAWLRQEASDDER